MVEAEGVELFRVLITRNLLILGTATTAKKAPLPDRLYVYCTKTFFGLESPRPHTDHSIPQIRREYGIFPEKAAENQRSKDISEISRTRSPSRFVLTAFLQ
jgi:hypothetical protein